MSFVRGGRTIIDDVSLRVERGQTWALLGPNGAGKTSLLHIAAAVTFPSRGRASILGHTMGRFDLRELRRSIGFVEPRHPLDSDLPAIDLVLTGLTGTVGRVPHWQPSRDDFARSRAALDAVGVAPDRRWFTMSQGERGRALIARALVSDPPLLLLDEPSTGLDLAARERMIATIDSLSESHPDLTTVMVTHHFEELPPSTSHAALMRDGRILAAGIADDVITTENVSACFDFPATVERRSGRWFVASV